ncbi:SSU ribosomal protein S18P alanine acetyltransferase [Shewanella sp. MR-4]|uniref:ribosomal protein S18-alanine N-acetyltransferase n=1 Tax=Shewanella sp. (strain MR-4) TaxID=60480 RepID=UPI00005E59A2|nr:ribosomal protein S18-alanine N-acetyltransferase [Shewanella sp. MR-4]ABI38063.1 SSU ribosomal protein S18P alanine acetyltransferase [Shewanella sp. MR-4]
MQIVLLTPTDVSQMTRIEASAHSHPMSENNLADCFGHLYRVIGLMKNDGELLGFAIVQQIVDEATLLDICLSPQQQGRGYGHLLLMAVIDGAKAAKAVVLMLEVRESNLAARALYQKRGFVETGRRKGYYPLADGKEDAILMDLALSETA